MGRRVVVLGGGIAGLSVAVSAKKSIRNSEVTIIDNSRYHVFKPFLHDLLVSNKRVEEVVIPFAGVAKHYGITYLCEEVLSIAPEQKHVRTPLKKVEYDYLVIALGGQSDFHGVKGAKTHCPVFRDVVDVARLKDHLIHVIGKAKHARGDKLRELLTFVIIGGGVNGVELACFLRELVGYMLFKYKIKEEPSFVIVNSDKVLLKNFPRSVREKVVSHLVSRGIELLMGYEARKVSRNHLLLTNNRVMRAGTFVWCGGVKPNLVVRESRLELRNNGVVVNSFLQSASNKDVFALGDCAFFVTDNFDKSFSKNALNSYKQARLVSKNLKAWIIDKKLKEFRPSKNVTVLRLGSDFAIFHYKNLVLQGFLVSKLYDAALKLRFKTSF
jgi:NADH dehydrogenase